MKPRTLGKRKGQLPAQVVWEYAPTDRQKQAHDCAARYKLYGGALGGGKTVWLSAEAIRLSLSYPGNRGYFCRQYVTDFKRSTLVTFSRLCPAPFIRKHYRDDRIIEFFNGSEILYGGLGSEEDLERIKSTEFGWFAIDEATEAAEEFFLLLCGRLRWKLADGTFPRFHGLLASNPEPGWVKERFVDQRLKDHAFIPALPRDNQHNPKDYDSTLRSLYPEEWVKRYLDGSWDVFEGQIYKEFDRKIHCYQDVDVGQYWDKYRVIDHGYTNPTCCIYVAVDHDGVIWIHDEHYEKFLTIEENAHIIQTKQPDWRDAVTLIDPSCFSSTQQVAGKVCSVADEYAKHGIVAISPYSRDGKMEEAVGINLVKRYFKANKLKINERCTHGIRELLKYRWRDLGASSRGSQNEHEIPVDKDNHFCFAAGTLVDTPSKSVRIEDIRKGDSVITHLGFGTAETDAVVTEINNGVRLILSDMSHIICTEDHPFLTDVGWVKAVDLQGRRLWRNRLRPLCTTREGDSFSILSDTMRLPVPTQPETRTGGSCIESFGRTITAPSPMDSISTMSIDGSGTIALRTLSWLSVSDICWSTIKTTWRKSGTWLRTGISLTLEGLGIQNTEKRLRLTSNPILTSVNTAEVGSGQRSWVEQSFAAMLTRHMQEMILALMTKTGLARSAERLSGQIAIRRRSFAPRNALLSTVVEKVERLDGTVPVFNFSSSDGTYCVDGLIVSNCDCVRYFCAYRPPDAPPPPRVDNLNTIHAAILKHKKHSGQAKFVGW